MKQPTIGVVIATPGRRSLMRTMNSILYQGLIPGDDVLIVGDGYHKTTAELVELVGPPFRYVATEKTRDWGHSQLNYGLKHIRGDWVVIQDDDDIFLPRAFDEIRDIVGKLESPRPVIGRVMTPYLGILWTEPGREPLDGHCLVVPNDKERLGYFGSEYEGDQKWLATNLAAYDTYSWADRIWTLTRPTGKLWPMRVAASGACAWEFHRPDGDVWADEPSAFLMMVRAERDQWIGRIGERAALTETEYREVAEFAAWAGQGSDVWLRVRDDPTTVAALNATGYQFHQSDGPVVEFTFEWPPHKFEPPKKEGQ